MRSINDKYTSYLKLGARAGLLGSVLLLLSGTADAKEFEWRYSVDSTFTYQENPNFNPVDEQSVFSTMIKPAVSATYADEFDQFGVNFALAIFENSNEDALLDYVAPFLDAKWNHSLEYGAFGVQASYNQTATRAEAFLLGITPGGTGAANNDFVENITDSHSIRGYFKFDFDDHWSLETDVKYTGVTYSENIANINDYDLYGAGAQLVYQHSDVWANYAEVSYQDYNDKVGSLGDSEMYSVVVGGIYTPAENIKVDFNVGGFDVSGLVEDSGFQMGLVGQYEFERYSLRSEVYQRSNAGGNGVYQTTQYFDISGKYQLTELSSVYATYVRNVTEEQSTAADGTQLAFAGTDITSDRFTIGAEKVYENWKGAVYFARASTGNDITSTVKQNIIGLSLIYNPFTFDEDYVAPSIF